MTTTKKPFDLGIYQFRQILRGPLCKDEHKLQSNSMVAVLHPLKVVDPDNLYCFGLDFAKSENVFTLMRKNLNFKKVITLTYEHHSTMDYVQEIHAKYHAAQEYLKKTEQLTIPV
jgi:hypothetical protein